MCYVYGSSLTKRAVGQRVLCQRMCRHSDACSRLFAKIINTIFVFIIFGLRKRGNLPVWSVPRFLWSDIPIGQTVPQRQQAASAVPTTELTIGGDSCGVWLVIHQVCNTHVLYYCLCDELHEAHRVKMANSIWTRRPGPVSPLCTRLQTQ